MKESDFTRIPIDKATEVPTTCGTFDIMTKRYWLVTEDNCILFYRSGSAQCNSNRKITEKLLKMKNHPGVKIEFLPSVFIPHTCIY